MTTQKQCVKYNFVAPLIIAIVQQKQYLSISIYLSIYLSIFMVGGIPRRDTMTKILKNQIIYLRVKIADFILFPRAVIQILENIERVTCVFTIIRAWSTKKIFLIKQIDVNCYYFVSHALPPKSFSREWDFFSDKFIRVIFDIVSGSSRKCRFLMRNSFANYQSSFLLILRL